jgi:threonine dehydratase
VDEGDIEQAVLMLLEIELVLQTRGQAHVQQVLERLRAAEMEAALM